MPSALHPTQEGKAKFEALFGLSWENALAKDLVLNAIDACARYGVKGEELEALWSRAKDQGLVVKFGGGLYVAKLSALADN